MLPLIPLGGSVYLPTYFLMISLGFCGGIFYFLQLVKQKQLPVNVALDLSLALMIGSFLGARLFHVFYEEPSYYLEEPWAVLWVWQGGFVFYGGLIGALLFGALVLQRRQQPFKIWLDPLAVVFPLVYAWGRLATLFSGSGYGRPTDLPWAITYPPGSEAPSGIALHPTPIYSLLWNLLLWTVVVYLYKKRENFSALRSEGQIFFLTALGYGGGRLLIEQFRDDPRGHNWLNLSVSSWISIFLILICLFLLAKNKKPKE